MNIYTKIIMYKVYILQANWLWKINIIRFRIPGVKWTTTKDHKA